MDDSYILAVDQGTSGTKAVVFDTQGQIRAQATEPLTSYFPQPGFVEQEPEEIFQNVLASVRACVAQYRETVSTDLRQIKTCGISNQRETFLLWDRDGKPLCRAIVWQCKRSVEICNRLKDSSLEDKIKARTGLMIDPYFSGTKLLWLYENAAKVRQAIDTGQAFFGTVDTWLLYRLTCEQQYLTDYTNASRTLFFNLDQLQWDQDLLAEFGLSQLRLPELRPSSDLYGSSNFAGIFARDIPISALIGDSHAAAFGEGCFSPGTAKATLGTGCSILLNTGSQRIRSTQGMVTTICWSTRERVDYALEGIIVTCGATIAWLRDNLGLFAQSRDTQAMAQAAEDSHGVYLVPAFSGLGTPHWRMDLKAAITGLTLGCDKNHIVRAALESIPFQIKDVLDAMEQDSDIPLQQLQVDGGITANGFVMQCLADLLGTQVVNIGIQEVSALGAAHLAGLQQGTFKQLAPLAQGREKLYSPGSPADRESMQQRYQGWIKAVQQLG
jgi:glycerol kinase